MSSTLASSTASPSQPLITTSMAKINAAKDFSFVSCSSRSLADALIAARGKKEATKILQEAATIAKAADAVMVSPDEKKSHKEDSSTELLGQALLSAPFETSFLSPRMGKFQVQLYENGLLATKTNDPTVKLTLLKDDSSIGKVSHVLSFPKPEDCKAIVYNGEIDEDSKPKKVGGNLVVLYLENPLEIPKQKSPTQQLCFALPADKKMGKPTGPALIEDDLTISSDPTKAWGQVLHKALGGKLAQVLNGDDEKAFQSYQAPNTSTTTAGMPFVSCYLGVNDGVLYPLEEGLLFYKPPRFLPRSNLHSIACGRGGGGGDASSRYVDMVIQCSQEETIEFTNIQREENSVLNSYIHGILVPAMKKDAAIKNDDDESDESDEVQVQAVAEDDETEDEATVDGDDNEESDSDEDFGDSDSEDGESSDEEDEIPFGEDDEGIAVVKDDFAQELVKRKKEEGSDDTESEDEDSSRKRRPPKRRCTEGK